MDRTYVPCQGRRKNQSAPSESRALLVRFPGLLKTVCIYAGSLDGARPEYRAGAEEFARLLASDGVGVVYGGGRAGLMGAVADAARSAGGAVTGVIDFGMWRGGPCELDFAVLSMYHPDVSLAWLGAGYGAGPFDKSFYRRVLSERIAVGIGFLAHDLRLGNADYLELALLGLRGSLHAWRAL